MLPASLEDGAFYLVFGDAEQVVREVAVGTSAFGAGTDTLIDFSDLSLQPRFVDPSVNLALTDPESGVMKKMHDGDPTTAMFRGFTQDPERLPGYGEGPTGCPCNWRHSGRRRQSDRRPCNC